VSEGIIIALIGFVGLVISAVISAIATIISSRNKNGEKATSPVTHEADGEPNQNKSTKQVKRSRLILITYLAGAIVLPILLLYPALIYNDLAGMGGYDGFATHKMMAEHGVWTPGHTSVYHIFAWAYRVWFLSIVNLPIAVVVLIVRFARKRNKE